MYLALIVLSGLISVLLMIIVLMQSSKGGGLAGTFGGSGMGTMFGTRRTADFLSRATWWLGGSMAVLALLLNLFFLPGQTTASQRQSIIQRTGQQTIPPTGTLPQQNLPPQQNQNNQQNPGTQQSPNK